MELGLSGAAGTKGRKNECVQYEKKIFPSVRFKVENVNKRGF